ncbi:hypothetical protein NDU88_002336 [Pleurodeles waltl]|uniref:Uncharacterized protein n=1 Tax=Pleurodeles waltl TaxID=8319 RepID=A0AAV7VE07_PLEWA|nr:hypothetical protein NDU88_002336 [Pleurodeles waltl]
MHLSSSAQSSCELQQCQREMNLSIALGPGEQIQQHRSSQRPAPAKRSTGGIVKKAHLRRIGLCNPGPRRQDTTAARVGMLPPARADLTLRVSIPGTEDGAAGAGRSASALCGAAA